MSYNGPVYSAEELPKAAFDIHWVKGSKVTPAFIERIKDGKYSWQDKAQAQRTWWGIDAALKFWAPNPAQTCIAEAVYRTIEEGIAKQGFFPTLKESVKDLLLWPF